MTPTYTLRQAGADDKTPADYRDIFDELRLGRSLRDLVALRVGKVIVICDACAERIYITAQNERQRREGNRP